jgi:hypothetical protein
VSEIKRLREPVIFDIVRGEWRRLSDKEAVDLLANGAVIDWRPVALVPGEKPSPWLGGEGRECGAGMSIGVASGIRYPTVGVARSD